MITYVRYQDFYKTANGKEPFSEWIKSLDRPVRAQVNARIARIRDSGNFGDCKHFEGMIEIRIHFGPGFRFYCYLENDTLLLLLMGGDKHLQQKDVDKAKSFMENHIALRKVENEKLQKL